MPPPDPQQPEPKFCPVLSVGLQKPAPPPSALVAVGGPSPSASRGIDVVPCLQGQCAMWTPITNDDGKEVGGRCALALLPNAMNSVAGMMQAIYADVQQRAEPKAPAGPGNAVRRR